MIALYTIGHSRHELSALITLVRGAGIDLVVDVRSQPYSRIAPQYHKPALSQQLAAAGLGYRWMGDRLGGRPPAGPWYRDDGSVDYARLAERPEFVAAVDELIAAASTGVACVLCAEEDPTHCHRRALITPALVARGVDVLHLRGDGSVEPEAQLRAGPPQLELFS